MSNYYFEIILLVIILLGGITSFTDITNKKIYNLSVIIFIGIGIVAQEVFFCLILKEDIVRRTVFYILVLIFSIVFGFVLYKYNVWAAGDAKLFVAFLSLYPRNTTFNEAELMIRIFMFTFIISFAYIVFDSFIRMIYEFSLNKKFDVKIIFKGLVKYLLSISGSIILIFIINNLMKLINENAYGTLILVVQIAVVFGFNICIKNIKLKVLIVGILFLISVVIFSGFETYIFQMDYQIILFVILIMIVRNFSSNYNYKKIKSDEVKPGMVLSVSTIMMFYGSRVKGLPTHTFENSKSRLSAEEVNSIIRWSKTGKKIDDIEIVRLMPFAPFEFLGVIMLILIEKIL